MRKYFLVGTPIAFAVIFNLGYLFHEVLMGNFFHEKIGEIQREEYIIPIIALAFLLYTVIQAFFLHIFYSFTKDNYRWTLSKTAVVFGALIGFLWDGLQGGMIEVATFKMPIEVFWVDSGYHTIEGAITAILLSFFYRRFVLLSGS